MENETIKSRVKKLRFEKDEMEEEIYAIEQTIQELKEIEDKNKTYKEISIRVSKFIRELENDKANNKEIKKQIEHDINKIKGIENEIKNEK